MTRICVIDGHPDTASGHFVSALCDAYAEGADASGFEVSRIRIAELDVVLLKSAAEFDTPPAKAICEAREKIEAAEHIVFTFPLWMGSMPAVCKAFWEQVARGKFLLDTGDKPDQWPQQKLKGRTIRIIVTMGMPAFAYRFFFGAHSVKAIEAGIFRMSGFRRIRHTLFGGIGAVDDKARSAALDKCRVLGERAE